MTPYNPHAITNFIETREGTYRIIDLESSLVSLLYPVTAIPRLIREGIFPCFDDIDVTRLREYVERHATEIERELGDESYSKLTAAIDRYETAADAWHASERRYLPRTLRALLHLLETPLRWLR